MSPCFKIRVGIAAVEKLLPGSIGWSNCGGAVPLAIERLKQYGFVNSFEFEYFVDYTECDAGSAARAGLNFIKNIDVDVIIGPPCAQALRVITFIASIYRRPVLGWGFVSESDLSDVIRFPYLTTVQPNSQMLGVVVGETLKTFKWYKIAMLYYQSEIDYCSGVMDEIESTLNSDDSVPAQIMLKAEIYLYDSETTDIVFASVRSRARIILWCSQTGQEKRDYLIKVSQHGMVSDEYVQEKYG